MYCPEKVLRHLLSHRVPLVLVRLAPLADARVELVLQVGIVALCRVADPLQVLLVLLEGPEPTLKDTTSDLSGKT